MPGSTADEESQLYLDGGSEDAQRSFWRGFGQALLRAAMATGRGTAWAANAGYEHRNLVPTIINGAIGDKLEEVGDPLAIPMSFRNEGQDVVVEELGTLKGHVTVFVHGLMADETTWTRAAAGHEPFSAWLERTEGVMALFVRYNTGRHISHNGQALSQLLERLAAEYPGIEQISLVGHSMGGLVIRSAGHHGASTQATWTRRVASVVLLGAPNDGALLEQAAQLSTWVLRAIPTLSTQFISSLIDARSDGIKDLRIGILVADDWQRADAATMSLADRTPSPLLDSAKYHVAIGSLTASSASVVATYLGDGLVGTRSAIGNHDRASTERVFCKVFPKTSHLALLASDEVRDFIGSAFGP